MPSLLRQHAFPFRHAASLAGLWFEWLWYLVYEVYNHTFWSVLTTNEGDQATKFSYKQRTSLTESPGPFPANNLSTRGEEPRVLA